MKIKMLTSTNFGGTFRGKGSEHSDIPDAVAKRWIRNKLAVASGAPVDEVPQEEQKEDEVDESVSDLCDTDGPGGLPGDSGSEPTSGEPETTPKGKRNGSTGNNNKGIDQANADNLEAAKLATCAQVEYWFGLDESISITGGYKSIKIGSFSVDFGTNGQGGSSLYRQMAPRCRNYLNEQGLLYRGVKISARTGVCSDSDLSN